MQLILKQFKLCFDTYIIVTQRPYLTSSDFLRFYLMSFFCARIPSRVPTFSQNVSLAGTVSQTLCFKDLDSMSDVFCRMPLGWDLSDIFLMLRLGFWVFRRKTTEVKCCFHLLYQGTHYHCDLLSMLTLITCLR